MLRICFQLILVGQQHTGGLKEIYGIVISTQTPCEPHCSLKLALKPFIEWQFRAVITFGHMQCFMQKFFGVKKVTHFLYSQESIVSLVQLLQV